MPRSSNRVTVCVCSNLKTGNRFFFQKIEKISGYFPRAFVAGVIGL